MFSLTIFIFSETSHTEKTVQMFMPEGKLDLGTPPRHCYPLVIFLIRDTPENSTLHPDETVSMNYNNRSLCLVSYSLIDTLKLNLDVSRLLLDTINLLIRLPCSILFSYSIFYVHYNNVIICYFYGFYR